MRGCARFAGGARAATRRRCRLPTTRSLASTHRSKGTSTRLRLVGGKGGVGKTTCAAALAIDCALRGERTLVISADPAPSLADVLAIPLSGAPKRIPLRRGALHALEINARTALERWLKPRRPVLETIALRGTWLDASDVQRLLRLSLPGIDEIAALLEMLRFGRSRKYDVVVVDTAPTGHTLRMLSMPETLGVVAHVFDTMQSKHRALADALGRATIEDAAETLIAELRADARALSDLLRDDTVTDVTLITLPEKLAVEETLDAAQSLMASRIPLARVVVNRVTPPPRERCGWCDGRRQYERQQTSALAERLMALANERGVRPASVSTVAAFEREPIGVKALYQIANELNAPHRAPRAMAHGATPLTRRLARVSGTPGGALDIGAASLVMFGGKGGVGKTTCAAAAALHLAAHEPRRRVLLVSTDPAHSLGDVLDAKLSDVPGPVPGCPDNLLVRELDARRALDPIRTQYASSIDAFFDRVVRGSSFDLRHDREVMLELLKLAPPGLDELAAALNLVDLLGTEHAAARIDTLVLDTAPTGHALRLLEMPLEVQEWTKALMSILLKYQPVVGIGELGAALLRLSRGLGRLIILLSSPGTQFIVVTRAAALPRAETNRLVRSLRRLRISVPAVIVNAAGAGTCTRCRSIERRERKEIEMLGAALRGVTLLVTPSVIPPPVGAEALGAWRQQWRTSQGTRNPRVSTARARGA